MLEVGCWSFKIGAWSLELALGKLKKQMAAKKSKVKNNWRRK